VGHVLSVDFGAFVAVVIMVVVAVVIMVVVAVVIMVVVAVVIMVVVGVVIVTVVVMRVCAAHLQNDKVEGFDARGFEFKHVLAFL
jgi:hypothetical protein